MMKLFVISIKDSITIIPDWTRNSQTLVQHGAEKFQNYGLRPIWWDVSTTFPNNTGTSLDTTVAAMNSRGASHPSPMQHLSLRRLFYYGGGKVSQLLQEIAFIYFTSVRFILPAAILIAITLLFPLPDSYAQDTGSGLDFLNIGPSSRMLSISEATTAADVGPSAIYSNPSLLALENRSSLDASYTLWIANVHNQFAALNFIRKDRAFAFGVYSSGSSGFEARDRPGPPAGEFSIRYLSLSGAIAQRLGPFSIGVAGQYLREEVFQFRASGYAFNAGLTGSFMDDKLRAAIAIKNLGNMDSLDEKSTPLPSSFSAGVSASLIQFSTPGNNDLPVLVSFLADWSQPIGENPGSDFIENSENKGFFSLAMDLNIGDLLFVQSGYRWGPTERPVSFGLGLAIESVRVNYALVPFSTGFGTVHSFGVQYFF